VKAAEEAGLTDIAADVRQGTRRDAILHSVGANAAHGLRRTSEDKRRAVKTLLADPEWHEWSESEIARRCAVSHTTVQRLHDKSTCIMCKSNEPTQPRKGADGRTINTANIAKPKAQKEGPLTGPTVADHRYASAGDRPYPSGCPGSVQHRRD